MRNSLEVRKSSAIPWAPSCGKTLIQPATSPGEPARLSKSWYSACTRRSCGVPEAIKVWAYLSPFQTFLILQRCDPFFRLRCVQCVGVTPANYLIVEQRRIDFPRAMIEFGHFEILLGRFNCLLDRHFCYRRSHANRPLCLVVRFQLAGYRFV